MTLSAMQLKTPDKGIASMLPLLIQERKVYSIKATQNDIFAPLCTPSQNSLNVQI